MLPETSKVSTAHGCQWKPVSQSKRVCSECNHPGEKALNGIAASRVKTSAQHTAADKGRRAGLFEEQGLENNPENNPENIMMLCSKATVGSSAGVLQPGGVILFVKKGGGQGAMKDRSVDKESLKGL